MLSRKLNIKALLTVAAAVAVSAGQSAMACAACYGKSDSSLAKGMNWGIFSLLGVVVSVLGSIAAMSFVLARRASTVSLKSTEAPEPRKKPAQTAA
jgi:hypothetical protein